MQLRQNNIPKMNSLLNLAQFRIAVVYNCLPYFWGDKAHWIIRCTFDFWML